eukprot:SM000093S24394  [mRNA]  locus=s93:81908:84917:- [translate_table: standard]
MGSEAFARGRSSKAGQRKEDRRCRLNPTFQAQIRKALSAAGQASSLRPVARDIVRAPSPAELSSFATKQWESVLLLLVQSAGWANTDSPAPQPSIPAIITDTLVRAGLMTDSGGSTKITEEGFKFLLRDTTSQMWQVIREYVSSAEERGIDSSQLVGFLLELGFYVVGEAYAMAVLSAMRQKVAEELVATGLVKLLKTSAGAHYFVPTQLAANLSASLSESASWQAAEGYIIVETNFRVYAYTSSDLQAAILSLMARVEYRLPNLVVAVLTRESVNAAFANGITAEKVGLTCNSHKQVAALLHIHQFYGAEWATPWWGTYMRHGCQIASYLQQHAHPKVAQRVPMVPENVVDQLHLWEHDQSRLQLSPAVLYEDFPKQEIYEAVLQYAADLGGLLWDDPGNRRLVVAGQHHEQMRAFIRSQGSGRK